jgi:hypothetical protein
MKVLMVMTSHDQLGDTGKKTGVWLEEFAAPCYVCKDAVGLVQMRERRPFALPRWKFELGPETDGHGGQLFRAGTAQFDANRFSFGSRCSPPLASEFAAGVP